MITKYLRELLKPIINDCMYENEGSISNRYIADMKSINKDLYDIRMRLSELTDIDYAGDIADKISTYEIARNIEIDASDLVIDYRDLGSRIANEIYSNDRIHTLERKMDLILNHLGIGAEDLLVHSISWQSD